MTARFRDNRRCFVCGEKNPDGLKLRLQTDAERGRAETEIVFDPRFQGWAGVVHGGLVATVLDEALIYAAGARGFRCVTGEITVRYVRPVSTGTPYALKGRFVRKRGRVVLAESSLLDAKGREVARASGKLFRI